MQSKLVRLLLLVVPLALTACDSKKQEARKERFGKDDFFSDAEGTLDVSELKNEMKEGATDLLKSFAGQDFPWQRWNKDLLRKAKETQVPVFVLIASSLGPESRIVVEKLTGNRDLNKLLSENFVCSAVDIHANPEIGILSYHLANEINKATNFPTLLWLSHEGSPIAWTPVDDTKTIALNRLVRNAVAMVNDTWKKDSEYAVTNSRKDNEQRNIRLTLESIDLGESSNRSREEVFRSQTRHLSSLYSSNDRDLDYIGGLVPTSSLELLSLGGLSNLLTEEVNQRSLKACAEVAKEVLSGALRDQLDDTFFYARRTTDWSLPYFFKSLTTQAKIVQVLIQVGVITNQQSFIDQALQTLEYLKKHWIEEGLVFIAPSSDQDLSGKFLWNWQSLEEAVGRENLPLAAAAFGVEKNGNIPSEVDPLGKYFRLNSLRFPHTPGELATQLGLSVQNVESSLASIKEKLLAHRAKNVDLFKEKQITCLDLASVTRALCSAAVVTGNPDYLDQAKTIAARLTSDYLGTDEGLFRIPGSVPARATDYASVIIALNDLYQITLDGTYLETAKKLADEAIDNLGLESGLIAENPADDAVIPVAMVSPVMIFSDSSLALIDQAFTQLKGITGTTDYDEFRSKVDTILPRLAQAATVNHTDFLTTCALGNEPLVAVVRGNFDSGEGKKILSILNSRKHLPFLCVRQDSGSPVLSKLENLPSPDREQSVVFMRNGAVLGEATDASSLTSLLSKILFERE